MLDFNTINFNAELSAIRTKYGERFFANENAILEAADLWGCQPNEHGVCRPLKTETIAEVGQCQGSLSFYETSKGYWLMGISTMSSYSGRGYAPSVWDNIGYPSYDDMRLAGVLKLIVFFEGVIDDTSSCNSNANRLNAKQMLRILEAEKTPQLSFF